MSRGVNKAIIVGRLGNDPDIRYTQNGTAVATLSLATTERWKNQQGNYEERTEWHRVVYFGRLAEVCGEYLRKGSQIYVEGSLRTNKYTDRNGIERYSTEINGREMQMLGGGNQQTAGAYQQQNAPQSKPMENMGADDFEDFDKADPDIPF